MTKSKLIREIRIYLYDNGAHEVRIVERASRPQPQRDEHGRFAPKHARRERPAIYCPTCGTKIVL